MREVEIDYDEEEDGPEDFNVLGKDGPRVCSRMCDTCIFAAGNPMELRPGRLKEMVSNTLAAGSYIPCHETIRRADAQPAICRGFYDRFGARSNVIRIWGRLGGFVEIDPPGIRRPAPEEQPCEP